MEFLQLSETTRARENDAELKKNKWRNEWLDPTRAWIAPGPLPDIFLLFSKTKIFHSHPWYCADNHKQIDVCLKVKRRSKGLSEAEKISQFFIGILEAFADIVLITQVRSCVA